MSLRRRLRSEETGLSFVEVLVTLSLTVLIMSIATGSVIQALQAQRRQVEYTTVLNETKIMLERMTRDIRGANPVLGENLATLVDPVSPSPQRLRFEIINRSDDVRRTITYSLEDSPPDACGPDAPQCQRLRVRELRQELSTGTQTADIDRILLDGIALDPGRRFFYYEDEMGSELAFDPANGIVINPSDIRTIVVFVRMDLRHSASTVDFEQTISIRNQEVSA